MRQPSLRRGELLKREAGQGKMQLHRGKHDLLLFFYFFFSCVFFFLPSCRSGRAPAAEGWAGMPLQYLSREELSRVAGYGEEALSSVLVAGTVVCDVCRRGETEFRTSYVQGAKVAVRCKTDQDMIKKTKKKKFMWAHGRTDEYGDFTVHLPSQLHAIPSLETACRVRAVRAPRASPCRGLRVRSEAVKLSSVGNSIRAYSAGVIRLVGSSNTSSSSNGALCMIRRTTDIGSESMW